MELTASEIIQQRIGLAATTQFRSELARLLPEISNGDIDGFTQRLHDGDEAGPAWQALIQSLMIGETYFFRDEAHFRLLRRQVLPDLIHERRELGHHTLNLWCVGCATGEEVYSLAITLYELLDDLDDWTIRLFGTDLNNKALEQARYGVYRPWSFRQDKVLIEQYFDMVEGGLRLKSHIREMVIFRQANLLKGPPLPQLDLILCRNVLLYFHAKSTTMAEEILHNALRPGGWLFMGRSEALRQERAGWITHLIPGSPIYQKVELTGRSTIRHHRPTSLPTETQVAPSVDNRIQNALTTELAITPITAASSNKPTPSYTDAVRARQSQDSAKAEVLLKELLEAEPDHLPGRVLLACICADQHRFPEARAHLEAVLRVDAMMADAHYVRGLLHLEAEEMGDARRELHNALYCQRNHPLASFTLGTLHADTGDIHRAIRLWENARQAIASLSPESPLSDMSDMTAGRLDAMIEEKLTAHQP